MPGVRARAEPSVQARPAPPSRAAPVAATPAAAGNLDVRSLQRTAGNRAVAELAHELAHTVQQGASTAEVSVTRTKAIQRNGHRTATAETAAQRRLRQARERNRDTGSNTTRGVQQEAPRNPDTDRTTQRRLERERKEQEEREERARKREDRERKRKEQEAQDERDRLEREQKRRERLLNIGSKTGSTYSAQPVAPRNPDVGSTARQRRERERKEKEDQEREEALKLEELRRKEREDREERERQEQERERQEQERERKEKEEQARKALGDARKPQPQGREALTELEAKDRSEQEEWERKQVEADVKEEEERKRKLREKIANQKREKESAVPAKQPGPPELRQTDLHIAVLRKDLGSAKSLVDSGANPFASDANGESAWTAAVDILGATEDYVLAMLRSKTVDWASKLPEVKQGLGDTALHFAARTSAQLTTSLLHDDPARVKVKDKDGKYPLAYATDETLGRATVDLLQQRTQDVTLLKVRPSASEGTPTEFEAMIHVQDEKHRDMFKGFAAESYKTELLKPLIDSMIALNDKVGDFKIIGSSDQSIWNAAAVPGLTAGQKSKIAGWTPKLTDPIPDRVYYSAGIKEEAVGVRSTARDKWGTLLHEATHAMMMRIFEKETEYPAAPFSPEMVNKANEPLRDAFIKIVNEIYGNLASLPQGNGGRAIRGAFDSTYTKANYPAELIVRVPQILGELGADEGEKWLREYVPSLLDFWTAEVVPRLQKYAEGKQ